MNIDITKTQLKEAEEHYAILLEQLKQGFNKQISEEMRLVRDEVAKLKRVIDSFEKGPQTVRNVRGFDDF